jgi:dihydrofolate synthase / folylpolyglutamate synthase
LNETDYTEALEFLYSFVDYEKNWSWKYNDGSFNLSRVKKLLARLGNPQDECRFVHVAGTNGKGSVASLTASALSACGYKTGLYTSPHLVTFRERIRINGEKIPKPDVIKGVSVIREAVKDIEGLTFFDVWTSLAFYYFAENLTDYAVIEVGMGGRLDSTNVITPVVSVITSISIDHRGKLGDTVEKIALEKAGIIKPGIPSVSAPQCEKVMDVLVKAATDAGSKLTIVGDNVSFESIDNNRINYHGVRWELQNILIPLRGRFQQVNTATSLAALEKLSESDDGIIPCKVIEGISHVYWPGRLQKISENPDIILDGACNIDAMVSVRDYLLERGNPNTVVVIGICGDKDVKEVLGILRDTVSAYVFTRAENPRSMPAEDLYRFAPNNAVCYIEPEPSRALGKAITIAGENGRVIVTGSLYLVGEIFNYFGILENDFPTISM